MDSLLADNREFTVLLYGDVRNSYVYVIMYTHTLRVNNGYYEYLQTYRGKCALTYNGIFFCSYFWSDNINTQSV